MYSQIEIYPSAYQKVQQLNCIMNCPACHSPFDCTGKLPVLTPEGTTHCLPCFRSASQSEMIVYNKQLIRLMGRCPEHLPSKFFYFCIEDKKQYCRECVKQGQHLNVNKSLIQISKMGEVLAEKTLELRKTMNQVKQGKEKIGEILSQHRRLCFQKIENGYNKVIEELIKQKQLAYQFVEEQFHQLREKSISEELFNLEELDSKISNQRAKTTQKKLINKIKSLGELKHLASCLEECSVRITEKVSQFTHSYRPSFLERGYFRQQEDSLVFSIQDEEESLEQEIEQKDQTTVDNINLTEDSPDMPCNNIVLNLG